MHRELQGKYVTVGTLGEKVQAFVPKPLPPDPAIVWSDELKDKFERPIASAAWVAQQTSLSVATVNSGLSELVSRGILTEITGRKRNRLYSYAQYIAIMNAGTDFPDVD